MKTAAELLAEERAIVEACDHYDRRIVVRFDDGDVRCCIECYRRLLPIHKEHDRARKRERRAVLAAMPRCEFCNRRGAWRAGVGEPVVLCGHHLKIAKRANAGAGIMSMLCPPTGDAVRAMVAEAQ